MWKIFVCWLITPRLQNIAVLDVGDGAINIKNWTSINLKLSTCFIAFSESNISKEIYLNLLVNIDIQVQELSNGYLITRGYCWLFSYSNVDVVSLCQVWPCCIDIPLRCWVLKFLRRGSNDSYISFELLASPSSFEFLEILLLPSG